METILLTILLAVFVIFDIIKDKNQKKEKKNEAIQFAEWCAKNYHFLYNPNTWTEDEKAEGTDLSTSELYKIWKIKGGKMLFIRRRYRFTQTE